MQQQSQPLRLSSRRRRTGLAPMELVLVFPVLMMMAGLFLFVSNAAVWKLRSHGAAREAAFQQVHPRLGEVTTPSPEWRRADVSYSVQPGPPVWSSDPFEAHTLFRGPDWQGAPINPALLDGSQGIIIGRSNSDITSRLWPAMGIHYRYQRDVYLLAGNQWQYESMGVGHGSRRSLVLFDLQQPSLPISP
jgi:hypothetical protein